MSDPLVFFQRDPLFGITREEFLAKLKALLQGRVDACWIFGSFFSDHFSKESDVDLILVKETDAPFLLRTREFEDLYEIGPALDILVYTPSELENLLREPAGFWKSVDSTMVRIL